MPSARDRKHDQPALSHLTVRVPIALLREARTLAARRGTLSQFIREAVVNHIDRHGRTRRRTKPHGAEAA